MLLDHLKSTFFWDGLINMSRNENKFGNSFSKHWGGLKIVKEWETVYSIYILWLGLNIHMIIFKKYINIH